MLYDVICGMMFNRVKDALHLVEERATELYV